MLCLATGVAQVPDSLALSTQNASLDPVRMVPLACPGVIALLRMPQRSPLVTSTRPSPRHGWIALGAFKWERESPFPQNLRMGSSCCFAKKVGPTATLRLVRLSGRVPYFFVFSHDEWLTTFNPHLCGVKVLRI